MSSSNDSLTIFIPCYNEEKNIEATVTEVTARLKGMVPDYELLIINDCSTDKTGKIMEDLKAKDPTHIRTYHNPTNLSLGGTFRRGMELASKEFFMMVPGDNELNPDSVRFIASHLGKADMVIAYPENIYFRPYFRQILSLTFNEILNNISGFKVGYYNGAVLIRTSLLRSAKFETNGFAYQAEYLIQLLKAGHTYLQVPFKLNYTSKRLTALRPKNLISVITTIFRLFVRYRILPLFGLNGMETKLSAG